MATHVHSMGHMHHGAHNMTTAVAATTVSMILSNITMPPGMDHGVHNMHNDSMDHHMTNTTANQGHGMHHTTTPSPSGGHDHDHGGHDHDGHDHGNTGGKDDDGTHHGDHDHGGHDHGDAGDKDDDHTDHGDGGHDHGDHDHGGHDHGDTGDKDDDHTDHGDGGHDHGHGDAGHGDDGGTTDHGGHDSGTEHDGHGDDMDHGSHGTTGDSHAGHGAGHSMIFNLNLPVAILFPGWDATTQGELAGACVAWLVLAIVFEGIKALREYILSRMLRSERKYLMKGNRNSDADVRSPKTSVVKRMCNWHHILLSFLQIIQTTLGMFLMLVFMTFNVWLALSVSLGSGVGYFLFGWNKRAPGWFDDDCCV